MTNGQMDMTRSAANEEFACSLNVCEL